jgi:cell wall-associated NlpC family hydrolase
MPGFKTCAAAAGIGVALLVPGGLNIAQLTGHDRLPDCATCHSGGRNGTTVVTAARRYLGVPYVWGGTDPATGLDCSGFTRRVYRDLGVQLPRTAAEQQHAGTAVHGGLKNARPGDLLFWVYPDGGHHVAIYEGGGRLIEAPQRGVPVSERNVYSGVIAIRRISIKGE